MSVEPITKEDFIAFFNEVGNFNKVVIESDLVHQTKFIGSLGRFDDGSFSDKLTPTGLKGKKDFVIRNGIYVSKYGNEIGVNGEGLIETLSLSGVEEVDRIGLAALKFAFMICTDKSDLVKDGTLMSISFTSVKPPKA